MIRFLLLLMLALLPLGSGLCAVVDVYTGRADVADQGSSERARALPLALEHALRKYSGLRELEGYPDLEQALSIAPEILVTFYYESEQRERPDGSVEATQHLVAKFAPGKVDELAQSLQLPLWQPERDPLELWVVVDNGRQREVMPIEIAYVRSVLDASATERGQLLVWPEPDEEGMYPVDMQLLWGGYTEDLASLDGVGVVILAARREGLEWGVRANLGFGGENRAWRVQDFDLEAALLEGLQLSIDQVAASSAIAATDLGAWDHELTVTGLNGAADYRDCLAYLQGIGIVDNVTVVSAKPATMTFRLRLSALPQYLEQELASGAVLSEGDNGDVMVYSRGNRS
jgi:hypothetical protein